MSACCWASWETPPAQLFTFVCYDFVVNQAEHQYYDSQASLARPGLREDQIGLLGEEVLYGPGGGPLRLG